jgi:hypothetical protein
MRRAIAGLLASLVAVALAGCVTIPTSGAVDAHEVKGDTVDSGVTFLPAKPVKGASQEDILAGFIAAGTGTTNRFEVARDFLTTKLAASWNPNGSVIVTDATRNTTTRTGPQSMTLTVQGTARVDATGLYSGLAQSTPVSLDYRFEKVRGQWRISQAPDGIVLTPTSFSTIFGAYPLYFFDASGDYLVPDLRWFPSGSTTPDRIVRSLIAGPSTWLQGAVTSAFPKGEQLGTDGVTTDAGTATVDLSDDVLSQGDTVKSRMLAQLTSSLSAVSVLRVQLTAKGFPVSTPAPASADDDPQVGTVPVAVRDGQVGPLGSTGVHALAGFGTALAALDPVSATLDRTGQSTLVVLGSKGVSRVGSTGSATLLDQRTGLLRPTIDPEGDIWSMSTDPASLLVYDTKNAPHSVASTSAVEPGTVVRSMLVSRDGARLVLAVTTPEGPALRVAAVQRDAALVPTGLGPWLSIPLPDGVEVLDAAWVDPVTVGLLVQDEDSVVVYTQQLAGRSVKLGTPVSGKQLVGGNGGADALRVLSGEGGVLQQSNAGGWQGGGPTVSFLVPQQ